MAVTNFLTGGFLKGYRTAVIAAVAVLGSLASWAVGDATLVDALSANWDTILLALGLGAAAVHKPAG